MDDEKLMKINYAYPEQDDPNIQYKIYKKREFYNNKIETRPDIVDYEDIKEYRDEKCGGVFKLNPTQVLLSNFLSPDTPYKGLLVFHNMGTGKTCVGISIAEKFKPLVQKYNTKILVLTSGPLIKEMWKNQLLMCTGETYIKYQDKSVYVDEVEKKKMEKTALIQALQYYRFMSYRSFYKHVTGDRIKIADKSVESVNGSKVRVTYRKTDDGDFERDVSVDGLHDANNTLIIVDEAHNLTGNGAGASLISIIKKSFNLKVVLMTGTPMKNFADDIVKLLNFIRPQSDPIDRDKVFDSNKNHLMNFRSGGIEYLKKMMRGYISHVRGADPLTFATRVDKGVKPPELLFTKVTRCHMLEFQKAIYDTAIKEQDDALDRRSEAVANFVFPALSSDKKEIVGLYGREGLNAVKVQLKNNYELLNKKISQILYGHPNETEMMYIAQEGKTISGKILKIDNLKYFSTKFYKALKKINRLVNGKKGAKTAFIYSNLVKVGIEIFQEILIQNGYLEYLEDNKNYQITSSTRCYYCGKSYGEHNKGQKEQVSKSKIKISESSSEYNKVTSVATHQFYPATFIVITGKSSDEVTDAIPEDKKRILDNVFNSVDNKEGKYIKCVLGTKVMNEGISLKNIGEVHILDVYFNLGRVDQVVARGIRHCSHYTVMNETNVYPTVNVYKYVVSVPEGLSSEEELYKKAEAKYLLIKKVERIMKEVAIDCPLNVHGNMFKEEIEKYKNCGKEGEEECLAICDYTKCDYKCDNANLNAEFYDPERKIYKKISKNKLDYSTFTHGLARNEIEYAKDKIKDMYILNYMYLLPDIIDYVKNSYDEEKKELFDEFFVYKALDELIPMTENDFINYKDTIVDKHNRQGYLIYVDKYYIFQPIDQNENVPIYYRTTNIKHMAQNISLYNYIKNNQKFIQIKNTTSGTSNVTNTKINESSENQIINEPYYDFNSTMDYYDNREEYNYVGYIDKEIGGRKNKSIDDVKDVFKIREKRPKILEKKRETGVPTISGAVCSTAKSKQYLQKMGSKMGIDKSKLSKTRIEICENIQEKMLELEKYGTTKDGNKYTYVIIPANHSKFPFPYNLEDRVNHIIDRLSDEIKFKMSVSTTKAKYKETGKTYYTIHIKNDTKLKEYNDVLASVKALLSKDKSEYVIVID